MAQEDINIGAVAGDKTGDAPRVAGAKINRMTREIYANIASLQSSGGGGGGGSGPPLTNTLPQPLASSAIAGASTEAARADHAHARPSLNDLGAAAADHGHTTGQITGLDQTLSEKINSARIGQPNGVAPLGTDGLVPSQFLNITSGGGGGAADLNGLTDVVISSPALRQTLRYDGSGWVNAILGQADIAGLTTALTDRQLVSQKNAANGYAGLGSDGRLAAAQLTAGVVTTSYLASIDAFSTAYTAVQGDNNRTKRCTAAGDITVTLANLSVGTTIRFIQGAAGKMTFAAGTGASLESFGSAFRSAGVGGNVFATVVAAGVWNLSGALIA